MKSDRLESIKQRLRVPLGRYDATRAAQLSGIPKRTVYDWARTGILVPDFANASPVRWSYRDLVLLRLVARMRAVRSTQVSIAAMVAQVRHLATTADADDEHPAARGLVVVDATLDPTAKMILVELIGLGGTFTLLRPASRDSPGPMWGPNLVAPTAHTYIAPAVLGGEPCIEGTRITTALLYAFVEEQGLRPDQVAEIYPHLSPAVVTEAVRLERRMRRRLVCAA